MAEQNKVAGGTAHAPIAPVAPRTAASQTQQTPTVTAATGLPKPDLSSNPKAAVSTSDLTPAAAPVAVGQGSNSAAPASPFIIINRQEQGVTLPYFKGLIYGNYGSGKTFLCGTAADVPEMNDVLMISIESGDLTFEGAGTNFDKIDIVKVSNYKTIASIYDFLKVHCMLRDLPPADGDQRLRNLQLRVMPHMRQDTRIRRYRTVIVDSLTEAETYCMNQLLGVNDATKIDEETAGAEWGQYRQQHGMVQRLIRNFRDLPMHVLFTAARAYKEDEMKRHLYSPMMTGKLASQVQGFMDLVGYLVLGAATEEGQVAPRRLYIQPGTRFDAKSRFSAYRGTFFDNPTLKSILTDVKLLKA